MEQPNIYVVLCLLISQMQCGNAVGDIGLYVCQCVSLSVMLWVRSLYLLCRYIFRIARYSYIKVIGSRTKEHKSTSVCLRVLCLQLKGNTVLHILVLEG